MAKLINEKIKMLKDPKGFNIKLSREELKSMFSHCKTEIAVENTMQSIIMKYL